jgi:glycosyltransferase involved in cell wall biosynthesis
MIPTRNRTELLAETLASVLVQDQGERLMQITVVDNSDHACTVPPVVEASGGSRARVFRQPAPVGMAENWNTCLAHARGELVHLLHDDDLVLPGFYQSIARAAATNPDVGAFFCRFSYIDEHNVETGLAPLVQASAGVLRNAVDVLGRSQQVQASAIVVRRVVYERLGGFRPDLNFAPDWEMWVRIACTFPVWYEPERLACYRLHGAADTARVVRLGLDTAGSREAIKVFAEYLPAEYRRRVPRWARKDVARRAVLLASRFAAQRDLVAAARQLFQAVRTSRSPWIVVDLARHIAAGVRGSLRRALFRAAKPVSARTTNQEHQ